MPLQVHLNQRFWTSDFFTVLMEGGKMVAVTYTGPTNTQDLWLCVQSLSSLTVVSACEHALTVSPDLHHILAGDSDSFL